MLPTTPSAGYAIRIQVELHNVPGVLGKLTSAIGLAGGNIGSIDLVEAKRRLMIRDISVNCGDEAHGREIAAAVAAVDQVRVLAVSDRTFDLHRGGKIGIALKHPILGRDDLSMAYTPGVGRIAQAIAADTERVWELTGKPNAVAVLSNGSAVLGLGDVGPEAALPVMEGKAMLFKHFAGIDAYPLCVRARDPEAVIAVAKAVAPGFGGINLEDIAAPACFEIERRLRAELDIPVFHDDQHGTAVVVLAALRNAARVLGRDLAGLRVVVLGIGAAGVACARLLLAAGITDVVGVDRDGILDPAALAGDADRRWVAERGNPRGLRGGLDVALAGADVLIGVSGPGAVTPAQLAAMAPDAAVFALANPVPEVMPELVPANIRVIATGRSDYPNQINNVLVFPGIFRGLLDARARTVDEAVGLAAAEAIACLVGDDELAEDYVIPSVFDPRVVGAVARAVADAADRGRREVR